MAITTVQGMIDGVQPGVLVIKANQSAGHKLGCGITYWNRTGAGGATNAAGTYNNTLNGVTLTNATPGATAGSLRIPQSSGSTIRLARHDIVLQFGCVVLLCDRIWHNGGIDTTLTTAQNITSPAWPARDDNDSTDGVGVMLALETSANTGIGAPTITVIYTNSSGTGTRTAVTIVPVTSSIRVGNAHFLSLQGGDVGVRSVQSIQFSEALVGTVGTVNLVAYRVMAVGNTKFAYHQTSADMLACGCPTIPHESVAYYMLIPGTTALSRVNSNIYTSVG